MRKQKNKKCLKVFTFISVMLFVSTAILAGTPMYSYAQSPTSVSTSDDVETTLYLHNRQAGDNTPFQAMNMFPGDVEVKNYCVKVAYKDKVTVKFHADVREGYNKLAEVLKCKIVLLTTEEALYEGLMRDMPESLDHVIDSAEGTAELDYQITVYLETSVGNAYQNKKLVADFRWWVEGELPEEEEPTVTSSESSEPVEDPSKESSESSEPVEDPSKESSESSEPAEDSSEENGENSEPGEEPSEESSESPSDSEGSNLDEAPIVWLLEEFIIDDMRIPLGRFPKTGDSFNLVLWITLSGGSLFALILLLKRRKEANDGK